MAEPPSGWRPTLEDYVTIAAALLDADPAAVARLPGLALAESALAAPFASFGGHEVYPDLITQAAVLVERLVRNHPLPDGNKRTAFLTLVLFLERNGRSWAPEDVARDAGMVEAIAASSVERKAIAGVDPRAKPPEVAVSGRESALVDAHVRSRRPTMLRTRPSAAPVERVPGLTHRTDVGAEGRGVGRTTRDDRAGRVTPDRAGPGYPAHPPRPNGLTWTSRPWTPGPPRPQPLALATADVATQEPSGIRIGAGPRARGIGALVAGRTEAARRREPCPRGQSAGSRRDAARLRRRARRRVPAYDWIPIEEGVVGAHRDAAPAAGQVVSRLFTQHGPWTFAGSEPKRQASKWRCPTGECRPASRWVKADRLHPLIPRETARSRKLYRSRGAVERESGRLKHEWALLPLRVRGIERVRLHADLTVLAKLACALAGREPFHSRRRRLCRALAPQSIPLAQGCVASPRWTRVSA